MAIDPRGFGGAEQFTACTDGLVAWVTSARPAPGFDEVVVPGEIERRERARRDEGVPIDDELWAQLRAACSADPDVPGPPCP